MRRATHDTQWLFNDKGEMLGFALGFDFASEHEWGIERLKESFGVKNTPFPHGVFDRQISTMPDGLRFVKFKVKPEHDKRLKAEEFATLAFCPYDWISKSDKEFQEWVLRETRPYGEKEIGAAWSERDFAITVKGASNIEMLHNLYLAFKIMNIAIAPGKNRGFDRSHGLTFVILSQLEEAVFGEVMAADMDHHLLHNTAEKTGIAKRLKAAKKEYFALSPAWNKDKDGEVIFWLNPCQQKENNFGWYTVQDLDDWIAGKGKIPMRKE